MLGQTVIEMPEEKVVGAYRKQFNMEQLPGGLYFFHLDTGNHHYMKKIIRQ